MTNLLPWVGEGDGGGGFLSSSQKACLRIGRRLGKFVQKIRLRTIALGKFSFLTTYLYVVIALFDQFSWHFSFVITKVKCSSLSNFHDRCE